jgi:hypothetical protein
VARDSRALPFSSGLSRVLPVLRRSLHPERAEHEPERETTDRSDEAGHPSRPRRDLARLLELAKAWNASRACPARPTPRLLAGSSSGAFASSARKRTACAGSSAGSRTLRRPHCSERLWTTGFAQGEGELREVKLVRDFVRSFRDGKISLALRAPETRASTGSSAWQEIAECHRRSGSSTQPFSAVMPAAR